MSKMHLNHMYSQGMNCIFIQRKKGRSSFFCLLLKCTFLFPPTELQYKAKALIKWREKRKERERKKTFFLANLAVTTANFFPFYRFNFCQTKVLGKKRFSWIFFSIAPFENGCSRHLRVQYNFSFLRHIFQKY